MTYLINLITSESTNGLFYHLAFLVTFCESWYVYFVVFVGLIILYVRITALIFLEIISRLKTQIIPSFAQKQCKMQTYQSVLKLVLAFALCQEMLAECTSN